MKPLAAHAAARSPEKTWSRFFATIAVAVVIAVVMRAFASLFVEETMARFLGHAAMFVVILWRLSSRRELTGSRRIVVTAMGAVVAAVVTTGVESALWYLM